MNTYCTKNSTLGKITHALLINHAFSLVINTAIIWLSMLVCLFICWTHPYFHIYIHLTTSIQLNLYFTLV